MFSKGKLEWERDPEASGVGGGVLGGGGYGRTKTPVCQRKVKKVSRDHKILVFVFTLPVMLCHNF